MGGHKLGSFGSGQRLVAGCFEHGDEHSVLKKSEI